MKILTEIFYRIACSIISFVIYIFIISIILGLFHPFAIFASFIIGFSIAWEGILILLIASILVDEIILNNLLMKLGDKIRIILWILIYCILGMIIALLVYGSEQGFYIVSGVSVSVIYILIVRGYKRMFNYRKNKIYKI